MRSPWSLLFSRQAQLPQPVFIAEVLQSSEHLHVPPLDPLQQFHILLVLDHTGLQTRLYKSRGKGDNHLPWPTGNPSADTGQGNTGFLGCILQVTYHIVSTTTSVLSN